MSRCTVGKKGLVPIEQISPAISVTVSGDTNSREALEGCRNLVLFTFISEVIYTVSIKTHADTH
jgi:hypothetical protein